MIAGVWIFAAVLLAGWVALSLPGWARRYEKRRRRAEKRRRRAAKIRRRRRKRWDRRMAWWLSLRPAPLSEPEPERAPVVRTEDG